MNIDLYDYCPDNCPFAELYRVVDGRTQYTVSNELSRLECKNKKLCEIMYKHGVNQGYIEAQRDKTQSQDYEKHSPYQVSTVLLKQDETNNTP